MKVVHVNTHDSGGAAVAAYRLHSSLLGQGIDSRFLVLFNSGKFPDVDRFEPQKRSFVSKKIKTRLRGNPALEIQRFLLENAKVEMFSSPDTLYDLTTSPLIREADLIHLHWVSNFIDYSTFFKSTKKPVVWTFHDENPLLGGCHYSRDAQFLSPAMMGMENEYRDRKMTSLKSLAQLDIICPSDWMRQKVGDSFYSAYRIHKIFYGLEENGFQRIEQMEARRRLNINHEHTVLCAVASDLKTYRKGFDIILSLKDLICSDGKTTLLLAGEMPEVSMPGNVVQLGKLDDKDKLNLVYAASDALLFPSRQDNLPNVLLESLFCGTPALAFSVGGVAEIIQHGVNGLLADEVSVESFGELIKKFLTMKDTFKRSEIRDNAVQKFSMKNQVNRVINVYKERVPANP